MKRPNQNTPLNFTEKYKSRISLIVSVVTLVILCIFLTQMDQILIQQPRQEQAEQQKLEEEQQALPPQNRMYTQPLSLQWETIASVTH